VDDNTISEKIFAFGVQDTAREEMECVFLAIYNNGVSGIGAAVEPSANIVVCGENVDKLAFSLVTPLGSENDAQLGVRTSLAFGGSRKESFLKRFG
jgi:hypothetical protein